MKDIKSLFDRRNPKDYIYICTHTILNTLNTHVCTLLTHARACTHIQV